MTPHKTGSTTTPGAPRAMAPPARTFGLQGPTLGALIDAYLQDYQVRQFRSQRYRSRPHRPSHRVLRPRRAGHRPDHLPDPPVPTDPARRRGGHRHDQPGDLGAPPDGHARRPLGLARHRARLPRPPPRESAPPRLLRAPRIPRRPRPPARPVAGHPRPRLLLRLAQAGDPRPQLGRDRRSRRRHPALARALEDAGRADAPDLAPHRRRAEPTAGTPRPRQPARLPPRWDHDPPLAHGVAHRLPGGRGANPLPPRLSAYRRPQPDPRERPRTGRHAPDRAQEPRPSSTATTLSTSRNCSTPGTSWSPIWRSRRRRCQPASGLTRPDPPPRAPHHPSASYDAAPRKGGPEGADRRTPGCQFAATGLGAAVVGHRPSVRRGPRPAPRGATRDHRLSRHPWLAPL